MHYFEIAGFIAILAIIPAMLGGGPIREHNPISVNKACAYSADVMEMGRDKRFREHILDFPFSYAYGIGAGDFDGNGMADISVADAEMEKFFLLLQGKSGFSRHVIADRPGWYERHKIKTVDGKPIFYVVKNKADRIVRLKQVNGQWREEFLGKVTTPFDLDFADMNGDGLEDIVASTHRAGRIVTLIANRKNGFSTKEIIAEVHALHENG